LTNDNLLTNSDFFTPSVFASRPLNSTLKNLIFVDIQRANCLYIVSSDLSPNHKLANLAQNRVFKFGTSYASVFTNKK